MKPKKKIIQKIESGVCNSRINYWSDLFVVCAVLFWIIDVIYETIIATIVTIVSIKLSYELQSYYIDLSMWSNIATTVTMPLSCGLGVWMLKNTVQHAIMNKAGKNVDIDFPDTGAMFEGNETVTFEEQEANDLL